MEIKILENSIYIESDKVEEFEESVKTFYYSNEDKNHIFSNEDNCVK